MKKFTLIYIIFLMTLNLTKADTFAVLVGTGSDQANTSKWYWGDMAMMYNILHEQNVPDANIFIHFADGNPETTNETCWNCVLDLDGDENDELINPATIADITTSIEQIEGLINEGDEFIFLYSGEGDDTLINGVLESKLLFWGGEDKMDDEIISDWINVLTGKKTMIISADYSGGFINNAVEDEIMVFTSTGIHEGNVPDVENKTYPEIWESGYIYSEFLYYFLSAVRGWFPPDFQPPATYGFQVGQKEFQRPWASEINPDMDSDGITSMEEAYHYAVWQNTWSPFGEIHVHDDFTSIDDDGYYYYERPAASLFYSSDETIIWAGKKFFSHDIVINADLEIQPGTEIYVYPYTNLIGSQFDETVRSSITLNGNTNSIMGSDYQITFTSTYRNGNWQGRQWSGIIINEGETNIRNVNIDFPMLGIKIQNSPLTTIENVGIQYWDYGVEINNSIVNINSISITKFENDGYGIIQYGGMLQISNSRIQGSEIGLSSIFPEQLRLEESTISHTYEYGIQLYRGNQVLLNGCWVDENGINQESHSSGAGVLLFGSSPIMKGNTIEYNVPIGLASFHNSHPILNSYLGGLNQIFDSYSNDAGENDTNLGVEIFFRGLSFPLLSNGHNDIYDDDGFLISHDGAYSPFQLDVRYNYWGSENPIWSDILYQPELFRYNPFDREPNVPETVEMSATQNLFQNALEYEQDENWSEALTLYESLVNDYPDSAESIASIERMLLCTKEMNGDLTVLQNTFDELGVNSSNPYIRKSAKNNAAQCDVAEMDYTDAIDRLVEIMTTSETVDDSLYALIDILLVLKYMDASGESSAGRIAGLPEEISFLPSTPKAMDLKITNTLEEVMRRSDLNKPSRLTPTQFTLHPVFPNPFNNTTTIQFDLPATSKVKLTVHDVSGRTIATLIRETLNPGTKKIRWNGNDQNGNSLSSGVYFISLSNSEIVQSQKMILLK